MEREVGGGIGMGNTCKPMAVSFQCMTKSTTNKKLKKKKTFVVQSLQSCPTLSTPWPVDCQAPLSMRFSRQEYWSGLSLPSPLKSDDWDQIPALPLKLTISVC